MPPKDPHGDDLIGQTIADRYRIISRLGAGGMGVAYRAWDEHDGVPVVIKIPKTIFLQDPNFAERFYREIRLLQGLNHPHIVPIRNVGEHEGFPFVVLRFLPGGSLSDRRLRDGQGKPRANPAPMLHLWLPAVADALDHVHSQGVVHRDVKPANIFFDAFWGAFLGDFGVAKIVEESETFDKEHTLTATHMGIGTAEYMSPEQFTPKTIIDARTDQYALAVTVYEMLAGVRPFSGATAHLIVEVTSHSVPPLQAKRRDIPKSLVEAVHKGLSKNASDRFRTCREFAVAALHEVPPMKAEPEVARLLCPKCSKILTLPTHAAGQKGRCPKCHTSMKVADDLGALWLLDEARRQRVSQSLFEIDASEPESADNRMPEEDLKDFRPVSTPTVIRKRYRKGQQTPPWLIPAGIAAALLLIVVLAGMSGGSGGRPPVPRPVNYEQQLDAALKKLRSSPSDHAANEFVGRHWCFQNGDWSRGLRYLAKSRNRSFASPAENERAAQSANPVERGALVRVAKQWWELGREQSVEQKDVGEAIKRHAASLYREHVGFVKDDVVIALANSWLDSDEEFRQRVGGKRPPDSLPADNNLFSRINLELAKSWGGWTRVPNGVQSDSGRATRMEISESPPEEYDFTLVFTPLVDKACVTQLCWAFGSGVTCDFGGLGGQIVAFQLVGGREGKSSRSAKTAPTAAGWLQKGKRHTAVIQVRRASIAAYLDGRLITLLQTDYSDLRYRDDWAIGGKKLGVGSWTSPTIFHEARITAYSEHKGANADQAPSGSQPNVGDIPADSTQRNSVGMELKLIPSGKFKMGSHDGRNDERPVHEVVIASPFYLGVTEVTNAQWKAVMGEPPSKWKDDGRPVENVSWNDAASFCERLSALPAEQAAKRLYRLPTEAEWEYACRAGGTSSYSFGDDVRLLGEFGWFRGNSENQTALVGQKKPNAWGLFDMHGNVGEWCFDWKGAYSDVKGGDSLGSKHGYVFGSVYRGGSWHTSEVNCRSAARNGEYAPSPHMREPTDFIGLRVAMVESRVGQEKADPFIAPGPAIKRLQVAQAGGNVIDRFDGLQELSSTTARALADVPDRQLILRGVKILTPESARHLARFQGDVLRLDGVEVISRDSAEGVARFNGTTLTLDGLRNLQADAASALAAFSGDTLSLGGALTAENAGALAEYKGDALLLDRMTEMSLPAVDSLKHFRGTTLSITVKRLPDDQALLLAQMLAQGECQRLRLNGDVVLSEQAADCLRNFQGHELLIERLTVPTVEAAADLASRRGRTQVNTLVVTGQTQFSQQLVDVCVATKTREVVLSNPVVTPDSAEPIARLACQRLGVSVPLLAPPAAAAIAAFQGGHLTVAFTGDGKPAGIEELSGEAAAALASFKGKGELELQFLPELKHAAATALAEFKGGQLVFRSLGKLSSYAALSLKESKVRTLDVDLVKQMPDSVAGVLGECKAANVYAALLSPEAALGIMKARKLPQPYSWCSAALADDQVSGAVAAVTKSELDLSFLTSISEKQARAFASFKGGALVLAGLTELSPAAAKELAAFKGAISLGGLRSLSPNAAKELAACEGPILLNGLLEMSSETAQAVAGWKGRGLYLRRLVEVTPEALRALARYRGESVNLPGPPVISSEVARAFASFQCSSLAIGPVMLDEQCAIALSEFQGTGLTIYGLVDCDVDAAAALARFKGKGLLSVSKFKELTATEAKALASFKGGSLAVYFHEMTSDASKEWSVFKGESLDLRSPVSISDECLRGLAAFAGKSLSVTFATTPTDREAKILAGFKGELLRLGGGNKFPDSVKAILLANPKVKFW